MESIYFKEVGALPADIQGIADLLLKQNKSLRLSDLQAIRGRDAISSVRSYCIWLCFHKGLPLPDICQFFGNRSKESVYHALNIVEDGLRYRNMRVVNIHKRFTLLLKAEKTQTIEEVVKPIQLSLIHI